MSEELQFCFGPGRAFCNARTMEHKMKQVVLYATPESIRNWTGQVLILNLPPSEPQNEQLREFEAHSVCIAA